MPYSLRKEVLNHIFTDFLKYFSVLFQNCEESFVYDFITRLIPHQYQAKEIIIKKRHPVEEMYLITSGSIIMSYQGLQF